MIHTELIFRPRKARASALIDRDDVAESFAYPGIMRVLLQEDIAAGNVYINAALPVFSPDHKCLVVICLCSKICTISSKLKILPCESKPTFSMRPSRLEARSCKCP